MAQYINVSIDDTIDILKELTLKKPSSVFEVERLGFFKKLHDEYGLIVSFYAFFNDLNGFSLSDVTGEYREQFLQNAEWLRFGAHSSTKKSSFESADTPTEYSAIITELERIVGSSCIDRCFRPHFFVISEKTLNALTENGLAKGVYCPDDDRKCHEFTDGEKSKLNGEGYLLKNGALYLKTQTRLENLNELSLDEFSAQFKNKKIVAIFTHEYYLNDINIRRRLTEVCEYAKENALVWAFPMDVTEL